ncbi:serine hydrolase [Pelagibacterium montanilacus]|uniref:serine hydrolase n=1 Tax=Pelagibacterium montanilacus TaxID=2185280 RepID=UPI000F8C8F55|nr:serine hydrolase [Pelagibacterium montanilacus]
MRKAAEQPLAFVRFVFLAALMAMCLSAPAQAQNVPRAIAGIVVDAKTGEVLYNNKGNDLRYPASLTKVMTLYVLFQELEAGRMTLNTPLTVSKHAAAAVPTKLWVQPGSTITVENAIKALVTLSANDVARVIAENISGTESRFGERMTQTARALGMSRTTYRNASGLPDRGQVTTAADQATLARAVFQHFPNYYSYFQTRSFTYSGKTFGNHNRLLGQNGVDGIKTGYINASGYNLMTAARLNNRHIVAIGLGYNTGAARNSSVAKLVADYMPKARQGDYWREAMIARPALLATRGGIAVANAPVSIQGAPPPRPARFMTQPAANAAVTQVASVPAQPAAVAVGTPPPPRPDDIPFEVVANEDLPDRVGSAALEQATYVATGVAPGQQNGYPADDPIGAWIAETLKLGPTPSDLRPDTASPSFVPPASIGVDPMSTQSSETTPISGWIVQVGAAHNEDAARALLTQATETVDDLANLRSYVETFERNGRVFYRARFAGFADRNQARSTCDRLTEGSVQCLAVQG